MSSPEAVSSRMLWSYGAITFAAGAVMLASDLANWSDQTRYLVAAGVLIVAVPALLTWVHSTDLATAKNRPIVAVPTTSPGTRRRWANPESRAIAGLVAANFVVATIAAVVALVVAGHRDGGPSLAAAVGGAGVALGALTVVLYREIFREPKLFEEQHGPTKAEAAYRIVIRKSPDVAPRAVLHLAELLENRGDIEGARAAYEEAIALGDADAAPRAAMALGVLVAKQGDFVAAQVAFELAIESGQPDAAGLAALNLATLLIEQKDLAGARAAYQRAIDSGDPESRLVAEEALDLIAD